MKTLAVIKERGWIRQICQGEGKFPSAGHTEDKAPCFQKETVKADGEKTCCEVKMELIEYFQGHRFFF